MSAFEVYKDYVALKNHFTKPEYDYFKYNGKSRLKLDSFNKRKDKIFFEKLAKNKEYHQYLIANLSLNPKSWIRDIAYSDDAERVYREWLKKQQSLSYLFQTDLNKLDDLPGYQYFICKDGEHPILLKMYLGGEISFESFCILLKVVGGRKYWDKHLEYDPVWEDVSLRVRKYTPFLKFDQEKFRKILLDKWGD